MASGTQAQVAPRAGLGAGVTELGDRGRLAEVQRARLIAAMIDVTAERGLAAATVARVVSRSGVSRRTFYDHFEDREECFLAAFEHSIERLAAGMRPAYAAPGLWPGQVRSALAALLDALAREPAAARVAIVEALGAGPRALERRRRVLEALATAVEVDGNRAAGKRAPSPLTAEGAVGGVFALLHARLVDPQAPQLAAMLGSLVAMVVLPYLGPAAARRELERPVEAVDPTASASASDPLRDLDMRLTYRTLRVLLTVGELAEARADQGDGSHASNRAVGDASGIRDQGQISKLLARLRELGLVRNAAEQGAKGRPNEWRLTERGEAVRQAVSRAESR